MGPPELLVPGNSCFKDELQWHESGSDEGGKGLKKQIGLDTERASLAFQKPRAGPRLQS